MDRLRGPSLPMQLFAALCSFHYTSIQQTRPPTTQKRIYSAVVRRRSSVVHALALGEHPCYSLIHHAAFGLALEARHGYRHDLA